jgi:hypothetical protein
VTGAGVVENNEDVLAARTFCAPPPHCLMCVPLFLSSGLLVQVDRDIALKHSPSELREGGLARISGDDPSVNITILWFWNDQNHRRGVILAQL